ncbi:hypothetical protein [Carnobacterium viridans]|uniref:Histidine kinase N-terminal 7TM region domain-containing protein n=1 Tax=Carnobacterium viridans TaxID=174587 RepID=A0A1H0ZA43_9LACT|nr:hypothetical protein [Carnobacterium viridans]SDQ24254.1 hypothetical protein SAMN04487752_1400 [Carnobacterium viridans]
MFAMQPFYAIVVGIIYIGSIYLLIRKEKKYINYSLTMLACILQSSFLFLWFRESIFLMTSRDVGFQVYANFSTFVNISYFVLFIPQLVIFAWYGLKKIGSQDQFALLKIIFQFFYVGALIGILILGQPIFEILYYGFAP